MANVRVQRCLAVAVAVSVSVSARHLHGRHVPRRAPCTVLPVAHRAHTTHAGVAPLLPIVHQHFHLLQHLKPAKIKR